MKRFSLWISAAAILLAGCQQEAMEPETVGDGALRITVSLDGGAQTKADDLSSISKLYFEVYDENDVRILPEVSDATFPSADDVNTVTVTEGKAVIDNIQLMKNRSYTFVFWAMSDGAPYTWTDLSEIAMNYGAGNVESDAFAGSVQVNTTSEVDMKVTLKRPFAQLNFGNGLGEMVKEGDYTYVKTSIGTSEKKYRYLGSSITVNGLADTFNAVTMTATNKKDVVFECETILDENLSAGDPAAEYTHMSRNYLLLPGKVTESSVCDVVAVFKMSEEPGETPVGEIAVTHNLANVPLQANYRTNLVGSIFTFGNNLSITLDQWAGTSDNELWDGSSSEVKEIDGVYTVATASELAWIAEQVNSGANDFAGKTVRIADDINLLGYVWIPIGTEEHPFKGTFDGEIPVRSSSDFFTISNLTVNATDTNAGLFGYTDGAALKNINFVNANITNVDNVKSYAGVLVGKAVNTMLSNVEVAQSSVHGACNLGGLAGYSDVLPVDCTVAEVDMKIDQSGLETSVQHNSNLLVGSGCDAEIDEKDGSTFIEQFVDGGAIHDLINDEYAISTKEGLFWMAEEVNKVEQYEKNRFDGRLVKLTADVDLEGEEWIPIGDYGMTSNQFTGTFDGQNYSVSNMKISKPSAKEDSKNRWSYGFFGNVNGTVRNLTIENMTISGPVKFIGTLVGRLNGGTVENCHVKNSSVSCNHWQIGGVVGQLNKGNISKCTVESTTVTGYAAVGGIVGIILAADTLEYTIEDCSLKEVSLVQSGTFGEDFDDMFGLVIGSVNNGKEIVYINNCSVEDSQIKGSVSSGMVGYIEAGSKVYIDGYLHISDGLSSKDGIYYVSNANGLSTVNSMMDDKSFGKGAKLALTDDIDFTGHTWKTVDSHADASFYITEIDGKGHTISNLTIEGQAMFRRFAGSGDVTIKDITFDNAAVNSNGKINTSILTVQSYQNVLLDNVDVRNSSISGGYKVAPLIATVYNESSSSIVATLKDCDVENVTVTATAYDFCTTGMVAFVYADDNDKIVFENCTVKDVTLSAPDDAYKAHAAIYTTGSGSLYDEAEGVTVTNVVFTAL